mmetsp:Transcript_83663/g.200725  ORF Transcript_83663/g.200725 Transcript_83663/m.200725 type:complete len:240 (+) Transcript_83663:50-769(+)
MPSMLQECWDVDAATAWPVLSKELVEKQLEAIGAPPGLEMMRCGSEDGKAATESTELEMTRTPSAVSETCEEELMPSIGSFGHPELCAPPCVYFAWGPCVKGVKCGFCHLAHRENIGKLDKRQRKTCQKLEEAEMIDLVLPHLQERAKRLESIKELDAVLSVLSSRRAELPHQKSTLTLRKVEKLSYVLRQMPFQALLGLVLSRDTFEPSFLEDLTLAYAQLRARCPTNLGAKAALHWL